MGARRAAPDLVAREAELVALRSAVASAAAGRSSTVLVSGDAGVGKSRLLQELADVAQRDGALVLVGRCVDVGDGELPYAPVSSALRGLVAQLPPDQLNEALGPARSELARLVPDLADLPTAATDVTAGFAKARLFELILGVFGRLGRRRPVLFVVEDLHWADSSTRDLLRFLVRSAAQERLALVLTYRTDDLYGGHPLRPYLLELGRDPHVGRLEVCPFSRAEFADQVAALLGTLPGPGLLDRLYARSEGNPFYTEELVAAGTESGQLPDSVRDAMLLRLDRLSEPARHVVRMIAAAGRRVDHRLISRTAGLSDDDLSAALREALAGRVLAEVGQDGSYEFRHALLREAAYGELLLGERRALHATLARELEVHPDLVGPSATLSAELAWHWWAAGEHELALSASVRAGEEAEHLYAYPEALGHLQRALELWEQVSPSARERIDRVELTAAAARAARASGERELAIALAGRAVDLADPLTDPKGDPVRTGLLTIGLAQCLQDAGRGEEARRLSAQALEVIPPQPSPARVLVLERHARMLLLGGNVAEARGPVDEAVEVARVLGLGAAEAAALTTKIIALHGRTEEAVAAGRLALRTAEEFGDPETLLRAYVNAAEALDQAGEFEAAIALAREGVAVSARVGVERVDGAHLKGDIAHRLVKLGRLDEALALVTETQRTAPSGTVAASLHQTVAVVSAHRGDAAAATGAAQLAGMAADDAGGGMWRSRADAACAEVELWRGEAERAATIVDEALARFEGAEYVFYTGPLYAVGAWAEVDLALRARALGEDASVRRATGRAGALHDRIAGLVATDGAPEPAAYRAQVRAELARLDDPPDPQPWREARHRWEGLGMSFGAAVCGWREAEALLASGGDRRGAAELLHASADRARAVRAAPLLAEIAHLARRGRITIGGEDPAPTSPVSDLTRMGLSARELEVLRLIADGRTNREIGATLFISTKTVSVHVSHILAKLGAANRAEAAATALRLGLPP